MLADNTEKAELLNSYFAFPLRRNIQNWKGHKKHAQRKLETSYCKDLHGLHEGGEIWATPDE